MIPGSCYLLLAALLFAIGLAGVLVRRHSLAILISVELMLNAAALNLAAFSRMWNSPDGQVFAIFIVVIAAGQAAAGVGVILLFFRASATADIADMDLLKW